MIVSMYPIIGGGLICRGVPPWAPALLKAGNKAGAPGGTPLQIRPLLNHRLCVPKCLAPTLVQVVLGKNALFDLGIKHLLVLADAKNDFRDFPESEVLPFRLVPAV